VLFLFYYFVKKPVFSFSAGKRIMLDDNKQKIEFLLNKSMIPKDFASKIIDILSIFSVIH